MHIAIERLYDFVMGQLDLESSEQSHLIRCDACIEWLDACVTEKIIRLMDPLRKPGLTDTERTPL